MRIRQLSILAAVSLIVLAGSGLGAAAAKAEIKTTENSIIVQGSGNDTVGPITFDQSYYIVKAKYDSTEPYSMLQVSYKKKMMGTEMDSNVLIANPGVEATRVFVTEKGSQPSKAFTFTVQSAGTYRIEFLKPPALSTAKPAPLTLTGGRGTTMTPLVKVAGNYVMLRLKYTAPVAAKAKSGMPLASATLYDAETGEEWVQSQRVYPRNLEASDGRTGSKPGVFFALVQCDKEGGTWEVTITPTSSR